MWHLPAWLKPWDWPERAMKWLRGFHEVRKAKYEADRAKIALDMAKVEQGESAREREITKYYNQIREQCEARSGIGFPVPDEPIPAPGENPELVREAWLRYMREVKEKLNRSWRSR